MPRRRLTDSWLIACLLVTCVLSAGAQSAAPAVMRLRDGEILQGHLTSATGAAVVFASAAAGTVTVPWSKVAGLETSETFAVIESGMRMETRADAAKAPQGMLRVSGGVAVVTPPAGKGGPQSIPLTRIHAILPEAEFQAAFHGAGLLANWTGGATGGVTLVEATQKNRTFTASFHAVRTSPDVPWLAQRSRTLVNFNEAYGELTQPNVPAVKTSLFHLDAEQDWFLSPRLFAFVTCAWDHSYSQGLDLQQSYGGGLGWVVLKSARQELDVKAGIDYINQRFSTPGHNTNLVGSDFGETYSRRMAHGITLGEQAGITPGWNDLSAYSAFASAELTFPVYHHFGLTVSALDNFLNNPPPGFLKNSLQIAIGATYKFQ